MTRRFSSISVQTTLATGISNTALSMVCATGTASTLLGGISLTAGDVDQFKIIIDKATASKEIMYVTGVTSDTLTIQRGKDGTSAVTHSGGATIEHVLTGEDLTYFTTGVVPTSDLATGLPFPGSTSGTATVKAPAVAGTTVITLPGATGTLATLAGTETLTNKTLTSPIATGLVLNDSSIVFEGATADAYETTLTVTDPTADRTLTLPNATDTLVGKATTDTLTNKTLTVPIIDNPALGYATTATAAGTTTLTVASKYHQEFTGTTTQTVVLPDVTTLPATGIGYRIPNKSTGALTVNSSGGNLVVTVPANTDVTITCILLTGTTAASWSVSFTGTASAASAGGLTKIVSQTFTGASAVNVNNCFSASYKRYRILIKAIAASGSDRCFLKMRVGGVDSSGSYYYSMTRSDYSAAGITNLPGNNLTTGFPLTYPTTSWQTGAVVDLFDPFIAGHSIISQSSMSLTAPGYSSEVGTGIHAAATSYDGFSLVFASGTFTGEVVVYGYAD